MTPTLAPPGAPGPDVDDVARADGGAWSRMRPVTRVVVAIVGVVVGINLAIGALGAVVGSEPGGPAGSSLATGGDGVAAWGDLLRARGVAVEALREPLGQAELPSAGTVVVVDPEDPPTAEGTSALGDHLAGGGRVVLVGRGGAAQLAALTGTDPLWTDAGDVDVRVEPGAAGLAGVRRLRGEGGGAFEGVDGLAGLAVLAVGEESGRPVVVGGGGLTVVADASLVSNRHLGEADDAALAVALAGDGPVAFAEAEHGFGAATGTSALPVRWRLAAVGALVVALLAMWCVGQRLGPPELADRPVAPPRRAYVDALAAALSRSSTRRSP